MEEAMKSIEKEEKDVNGNDSSVVQKEEDVNWDELLRQAQKEERATDGEEVVILDVFND